VNPANKAATAAISGPLTRAARVPRRSSTTPLTGRPTKRPTATAVTSCAAMPEEIPKCSLSSGIAGSTMPHMPAISVLE